MIRISLATSLLLTLVPLQARENNVKAPALAEAAPKSEQGLTLTFTVNGKTDTRAARLVTLHVPAGQPVTPFLPAGPFTAKWEGQINSALRADYTFIAEVRGSFKLSINDTVVLDGQDTDALQTLKKPLRLNKGINKLVAEYSSNAKSDATVRLNWLSKEFPAEPIPPTAFTHDINLNALREGTRVRDGRSAFATLRCSSCHSDPTLLPPRGEGMPELAQDAPIFEDIGSKFNETWLAHWINDPYSIRPQSLMPRMFASPKGQVDQRSADLAAYFASTGKPGAAPVSLDQAPAGGALFANLGCIACHTSPEFGGQDQYKRTPLSHLKAKWNPSALGEFLKDPAKNFAWTHMPNFRLTAKEADELTAYLLSGAQREFAPGPKGDATRGAQLLVSSGCLNCHAGMPPTTQPSLTATLKKGWSSGCMATDATSRGNAPDFNLDAKQHEALLAFAATGLTSLKQDAPIEFAERQIVNMRCISCHARDAKSSIWGAVDDEMAPLQAAVPHTEEEGAPVAGPIAPMLTWTGEKLQPKWMAEFMAGHTKYKPRPWLVARMPGFAVAAKGIAEGLSLEHGFGLAPEASPPADKEMIENGGRLLGADNGFNCITCHGVGEQPPTAVFEAPGINLAYSHERLRKGYYHRWVLHPLRIDPESKMPRFADDESKTPLNDLYGGDAQPQFEAIWQALRPKQK